MKKQRKKYIWNLVKYAPIVPFLYVQSKYIRKTMPDLPPASEDEVGHVGIYGDLLNVSYIGESTMAGVGTHTHKLGLAGRVSAKLSIAYEKQIRWEVDGRIGYTKAQVIKDIVPSMDFKKFDLVLIAVGGNDSFALTPPSKWYYLTRKLIDKILSSANNVKICFTSLPPTHQFPSFNRPMKGFIGNQTQVLRSVLMSTVKHYPLQVSFVDKPVNFMEYCNRAPEGTQLQDLFSDGYHPSEITYDLWAEDIVEHLSKVYPTL